MNENSNSVNEIPENSYQFRIVFGLEIFPRKIIILRFWCGR